MVKGKLIIPLVICCGCCVPHFGGSPYINDVFLKNQSSTDVSAFRRKGNTQSPTETVRVGERVQIGILRGKRDLGTLEVQFPDKKVKKIAVTSTGVYEDEITVVVK